jgi:hypothetical protein
VNNMGKRLYVSPKSTAIEMVPLSMLSASLGFSDEPTDTSGRAREYDDFDREGSNHESNHNNLWDQTW